MQLPNYKELFIKKADKELIKKLFAASSIGRAPVVIKIDHLKTTQHNAISIIEEILKQNMISSKFPYPIFLLSTVDNYQGDLNIIHDLNELPKFFDKKEKMLNVKEQNLLAKVRIYQTKLFNTNIPQQMEKIKDFANHHKQLFLLSKEGQYLENLLEELEGK